jgi:hypothetical protein
MRGRFSLPSDKQLREVGAKGRANKLRGLQEVSSDPDSEAGSSYNFDDSLVIGFEDKLAVVTPISNKGGKMIGGFSVSVLNKDTYDEVDTIRCVVRENGKNYRMIVTKAKERILDVFVSEDGSILKGFSLSNGAKIDLSGKNFITEGKASEALVLQELRQSDSLGQASLMVALTPYQCLTSCLSSLGLKGYLITVFGALCGVVCALTAGAGCYLCAFAYLGLNLGAGARCFKDCGYFVPR